VRAALASPWAPLVGKMLAAVAALGILAFVGNSASAHAAPPAPTTSSSAPLANAPAVAPPVASAAGDAGAQAPPVDPAGGAVLPDGRIVLNLAGEDDLTKLPSVGPSRAKAILALRGRLGKFRAIEDLLRVKGIGRKTLLKIRPKVVVDRPAQADAGVG
jgi:competence protein ComEA